MSEQTWTGEMTLGDGSVVKGATIEEAFQNLAKMKVDTANALRAERTEKERLSGEVSTYQQQIQQYTQPKKEVKAGDFDRDEYYRLLNSDPVAANDYYFSYRFGRSPEDFNNEYQRYGQTVTAIEQQTMAAAFSAQHVEDFPHTPEAAKALREKVETLTKSGVPFNLDTMNYAYSLCVTEGSIKPVEKQEAQRDTPNPALTGGGSQGVTDDELKKAEALSDKELEKLLKKQGML